MRNHFKTFQIVSNRDRIRSDTNDFDQERSSPGRPDHKTHATSTVWQDLKDYYTLNDLETLNLWDQLNQKTQRLGGCATLPY